MGRRDRWINSSTLAARTACGKVIAELQDDGPYAANFDLKSIVPTTITEPLEVVDRLAEVLLQGDLAAGTRRDLADFMTSAEGGPSSQAFRDDENVRTTQTRALVGFLLAMPEYQAC